MKKPDITSGFFFFPPQTPVPGCRFASQLHIPPVFAGRFLFCIFRFWGAYSFCLRHPSAPHPLSAFKRQRLHLSVKRPFSFGLSAPIKLSSAWPEISGIQKNFKRQRRPFRQTPPFSFDLSAPKKTLLSLIGNFRDTKNSPRGESFPTRRKSAFSGCCRYL